jgi:hypothetical protein
MTVSVATAGCCSDWGLGFRAAAFLAAAFGLALPIRFLDGFRAVIRFVFLAAVLMPLVAFPRFCFARVVGRFVRLAIFSSPALVIRC